MTKYSAFINFLLMAAALAAINACSQKNLPQERSAVSHSADTRQNVAEAKVSTEFDSGGKSSSVQSTDITKLTAEFKEGMVYGDLRKKVVAGNWKPLVSAECKKNVVGDGFEGVCSKEPKRCAICDELPELNICSGDGHCITEFSSADGRQVLKISTYGDIQDGLVEGGKSRLFVSWWDVSTKAD
ncbi:hypothetical protein JH314_12730 [Xanthomonas campestris]|uniref:hypothetical protein n=1 Tax=Xanthomonas campestris TaxID=339 RepID=UPI00236746F9|nr:hypothetical protein [Xanthomonas campestris]WDJ00314.1 hypothetical protein JH314_12730 [Xanthomonas campestris]